MRFEYKQIEIAYNQYEDNFATKKQVRRGEREEIDLTLVVASPEIEVELNKLGAEGWEMVGFVYVPEVVLESTGRLIYSFKRVKK